MTTKTSPEPLPNQSTSSPTAGFGDIGAIVFYMPSDLTPGQVALINALSRRERCVVMLGLTDDDAANELLELGLSNAVDATPWTSP